MFFEYFREICTKKNTTPTAVVRKLGLSPSKVTMWKGGSIPKTETLLMLAQELNVPVCAFFGGVLPTTTADVHFSDDVLELVDIYQQLRTADKRRLFGKAYELLDAQSTPYAESTIKTPDIDMAATILARRMRVKSNRKPARMRRAVKEIVKK